ncbi:hypothetical protein VTN49DRAFT_3181 [Thermomyces lanuginosus]|uniref:uncharacterized protein n=1 Tax=Thermomyces lanuginosus TaxID=5541 RepID=UPI00374256BA
MRFLVRQHREGFCSEGETIDENPEWPGFDDLCEEYVEYTNGKRRDTKDAADVIFRYRHFRLKEMEQEGGVTWANTSVSKRLRVMVGDDNDEDISNWQKPRCCRTPVAQPRSVSNFPRFP